MKMKYLAVAAVMSMMASSVMAAPTEVMATSVSSAMASPSTAKVGECTSFLNGNMASKSTCSIAINHTPQTKTTVLKTATDTFNIKTNIGGKNHAKPAFSLDGLIAERYLRDANTNERISLSQAESNDADVLTCYETKQNNICYS